MKRKKIRIRREVRWFAEQMELKLQDNDDKTHWSLSTNGYLQGRIADELKELQDTKWPVEKLEECVDVANFAMMLADNIKNKRG